MNNTHLAVALALLFVVPGFAAADVVGSPVIDVTLEDNTVTPGEETTLELTVTNSGRVDQGSTNQQRTSRVTTARGLTVTASDGGAPINIGSDTRVVGTLPEGTETVSYAVTVDGDAEPGSYTVPVEVEYRFTHIIEDGGDEITIRRTDNLDVELAVENDARLAVVDIASRTRVGSTGTVAVTVENAGTEPARETTLVLESRNPELSFGGTATASRQLGTWNPGERRTVEYRVTADRTAGPQAYSFDATARYEDTDGRSRTSQTRTFAVTPEREQTFAVESVESTVAVGDTGTVTVEMRNEGPIPVADASVELASTTPVLRFAGSDSASRFAGAWEPGETRTLEYDLTATDRADTRSYPLGVTVTYQDPEGDTETAPGRSLGVEPEPEQSFALENVVSTLRVGSEGRLEGEVVNTGDGRVKNAVVVFETDKPNVTPIETEAPVGDLAAGESALFSLPVEISESGEPGPQQYSLVVRYRTGDGDRRTSDEVALVREVGPDVQVFGIETEGVAVAPGQGTVIDLTITNNNEKRLTDISANMFGDSPISVEDDQAFVGRLDPGESETVTFSVGASDAALAKNYPVSVDFQYEEPDGDTKLSDSYSVSVSVRETDGGLPLALLGGVLATVLVAGAVLYRQYG